MQVSRAFTSDLGELGPMRDFVADVCQRAWGCPESDEQLGRLLLALTEAAANVIRHAYQGEAGRPILLAVEADPGRVSLTLSHEGRDFDPEAVPPPSFDGSREGGFGLFLIAQLVDEVIYFRDDGGRRGVRLVLRRRPPR